MHRPKPWEVDRSAVRSLIQIGRADTVLLSFNSHQSMMHNYILQMYNLDNSMSLEQNNTLIDELFEYFDSLSDDEKVDVFRADEIVRLDTSEYGCTRDPGFDYLPDYLIPRLIDGRITRGSFRDILRGLFIKLQGKQICVFRCGVSLLIVKLILGGVLTREGLVDILDDIRGSVNLEMDGDKVGLAYERYLPEDAVLELPKKISDLTGEACVEVPIAYRNVVICVDVCKLILGAVFDGDEYDAVERFATICGCGDGNYLIMFHVICPCIMLVSEERTKDFIRWFFQFGCTCENYFSASCLSWYMSEDILQFEKICISVCGKPLSEYDRTEFPVGTNLRIRLDYLTATRIDDV